MKEELQPSLKRIKEESFENNSHINKRWQDLGAQGQGPPLLGLQSCMHLPGSKAKHSGTFSFLFWIELHRKKAVYGR